MRDLSSPEASDEEDSLNVLSVQRNAHRVAELLHGTIPGLDVAQMRDLPAGANKLDFMRVGLANAMREASRRSHEASSQSWDALMRGGSSIPPGVPAASERSHPAPPPSPVSVQAGTGEQTNPGRPKTTSAPPEAATETMNEEKETKKAE